ncbi:MAG: lysophospholipid acyltransferase family protein [Actinomycetota bacterium]
MRPLVRREPGAAVFYWVLKNLIIGPIFRLFFRPWVEGIENVPKDGPVILCPNHLSFIDSILMPLMIPRQVVFLGKSDYFDKWYISWFYKGAGVIPVRREGGSAGEASLHAGVNALKQGYAIGVYPEGTRSPDGRLYRGKTGPARMALRAQCPIVPVAVFGTNEALPSGKYIPKMLRIGVRYGKPLDFSRYYGKDDDRFVLRSITDELMYELMLLTGQEYVDEYASKIKGNIPKDAKPTEQRAAS